MGIASLVLGIIGLLVSFTWFADLSLICGIIAIVLGIIALVKKQAKGMAIAGIICATIGVIIVFAQPGVSSDGSKGTGVTSDSGSATQKQVSVSTENVVIEKVGLTKAGDLVLKVTNNNEGAVCLSDITTNFKDANGTFQLTKNANQSFVCIPAKSTTYVYDWGFEEDYSKYPITEFTCTLANISEDFIYNGITLTSNDNGSEIAVTLKNDSGESISDPRALVVYYKGDTIVGVVEAYPGSMDATIANGSESYLNAKYPEDKNYNKVSFDKFEVYYTSASKSR